MRCGIPESAPTRPKPHWNGALVIDHLTWLALPKHATHPRRADHLAAAVTLAQQVLGVEAAVEMSAGEAAARPSLRFGAARGEVILVRGGSRADPAGGFLPIFLPQGIPQPRRVSRRLRRPSLAAGLSDHQRVTALRLCTSVPCAGSVGLSSATVRMNPRGNSILAATTFSRRYSACSIRDPPLT